MTRTSFYRFGAAAASLSTLALIGMAFVSLPRGMDYPGIPALSGRLNLSPAESDAYLRSMNVLYLLDGVFLLGWIVGWTALSGLVRSRDRMSGTLMLVLGLAGAFMDLSENSIILGLLQFYENDALGVGWLVAWKAVQHLSYWLPFAGAAVGSLFLRDVGLSGKICAVCGTLLVLPAAAGLFVPFLSLFSNFWFLLWFFSAALVLWNQAGRGKDAPNG